MIRPARLMGVVPQAINETPRAMSQVPNLNSFASVRREPRSTAALTFAVCGLASSGRFFVELSHTVNISRSGCSLLLHTRPQTDSALALRAVPGGTALPNGTSQLLFQLAWVRSADEGWLIGAFALSNVDLCRLAFPAYTP